MSSLKSALVAAIALSFPLAAFAADPVPADQTPRPGFGRQQMADPAQFHKQMCTDRYAATAGRLASTEAKLNLTEAQKPAWSKWRQAEMDGAAKARDLCLAEVPAATVSLPERHERMEKMLAAKAQQLQDSQPALVALYQTLTPEQKAVLDQPQHGRWGHGSHFRHGPRQAG